MTRRTILGVLLLVVGVAAVSATASHYAWKNNPAATEQETYDNTAVSLAQSQNTTPAVMEERLRIAAVTCDIFKEVGEGFGYLSNLCRFNIVNGEAWWEDMPPRQLRDVTAALIKATS